MTSPSTKGLPQSKARLFAFARGNFKKQTVHEESCIKGFSDTGSIPVISTKRKSHTLRVAFSFTERLTGSNPFRFVCKTDQRCEQILFSPSNSAQRLGSDSRHKNATELTAFFYLLWLPSVLSDVCIVILFYPKQTRVFLFLPAVFSVLAFFESLCYNFIILCRYQKNYGSYIL